MVSPYFLYPPPKKNDDLSGHRRLQSDDFLAVVSSSPHHSHLGLRFFPVFFLNSATKKLILFRCYPMEGVTRGDPPSDASASKYV